MASAFLLTTHFCVYAAPQSKSQASSLIKPQAERVDMAQLEKDLQSAIAKGKLDKQAELLYSIGEEYWQTGNYSKAEQTFREAL